MAFNPALPQTNSPMVSAEMRAQFNGLKELIDQRPTNDQVIALVDGESAGTVNTEPLRLTVSNPPTQAQVQAIADKLDEVLGMLMRI